MTTPGSGATTPPPVWAGTSVRPDRPDFELTPASARVSGSGQTNPTWSGPADAADNEVEADADKEEDVDEDEFELVDRDLASEASDSKPVEAAAVAAHRLREDAPVASED